MNTSRLAAAMALALAALAGVAHAGKEERDFYAAQVEPEVRKAASTVKTACGCELKFDVKMSTMENVDHLRQVRNLAQSISSEAPRYCNDAPSKAAICKMKTLEVSRTDTSEFKFSNGQGISTTDGSSFAGWAMIARELDK